MDKLWLIVAVVSCLFSFGSANPLVKQQDSFYFDPAPVNQDVTEGEEVRLRCDVSNRKLISFYWTLNGRQMTNTTRRFQDGSDLRILWVDRIHDNGSLRCIATNMSTGIALRSNEARLNIFYLSNAVSVQLKQSKDSTEVLENSEVFLRCSAEGNPEPAIEWFRNKVRLFSTDRIKVMKNRLRFVNSSSQDNGVYSCRGRNLVGQADSSDNFVFNVKGKDGVQLRTEKFSDVIVAKKSSNVLLTCEFSGAVRTEWQFGSRNLTGVIDSKYIHWRNGSLMVKEVDPMDAGSYSCVGIGQSGDRSIFVVVIVIAYLDKMGEDSFEPKLKALQVVPLNGKYSVLCRPPKGLPAPVVRWKNPYNVRPGLGSERVREEDGILTIVNAEEADAGTYSCQAENLAGAENRSIEIFVSVAPKLSRPPLSVRVLEGQSAEFDCRFIGSPHPVTVITWLYDEKPVDTSIRNRITIDHVTGSLRIAAVEPSDEGNYACVVNTLGQPPLTSPSAHLYVEKQLRFDPTPTNTKLELGKPGKIACSAVGHGRLEVTWVRGDGLSGGQPSRARSIDGSLVFESADRSDSGEYTCIAKSDQGSISTKIRVEVIVKPLFRVRPLNTTVLVGTTAVLNCVGVVEDQSLTGVWHKDDHPVIDHNPEKFQVLANGSLVVLNANSEDSTKYTCSISDQETTIYADAYLLVRSDWRGEADDLESDAEARKEYLSRTIIISVTCVVVYLTVVIALTVYCSLKIIRARKLNGANSNGRGNSSSSEQTGLMSASNAEQNGKFPTIHKSDVVSVGSSNGRLATGCQATTSDKPPIHRNQIQTIGMLGKGKFGDVLMAKMFGAPKLNSRVEGESLVMVKNLSVDDDDIVQKEAKYEITMFDKADHPRVVKFLGLCTDSEPYRLAVFEYLEWGNLNQFLQTNSLDVSCHLNNIQRLNMCLQVAEGMEHLANLGFIHKDLATRNVLIAPNLEVKIASLGLCYGPFSREYLPNRQDPIPVRWMAPEVVLKREYSTSSDAWSFGVLFWEIFSGASLPYGDKSDEEVRKSAVSGENRLDRPIACSDNTWKIANRCLQVLPGDRPNFTGVVSMINALLVDSVL